MKVLRVNMPDGSKWDVPASVIANNRAIHYASKVTQALRKTEYKLEYDFTMGDSGVLKDWASNNMNWEQVGGHAKPVEQPKPSYQEGWVNGDKEVVEL